MSGLTEVAHLRAEVARLEAALAAATAPRTPPGSFAEQAADAVGRMDRSIEILTAVLAAPLLDAQARHAGEHGVDCPQMDPVDLVRSYAQVTAAAREHLGGKAGGRP